MKKQLVMILVLAALMIGCSTVAAAEEKTDTYGGAMKGDSANVGQYLQLKGLDIRVDNWGFVTTVPTQHLLMAADYYSGAKQFQKSGKGLLRVDLLLKNSTKKPIHVFNQHFKGTVVAKDERSFNLATDAIQKFGNPEDFDEDILPGQPVRASIYVQVAKDALPAKLVLRNPEWEEERVLRFFLQKNLPEELITGTVRAMEIPEVESVDQAGEPAATPASKSAPKPAREEVESDPSFGEEVGDAAADAAKDEVKQLAREKARREMRKLIRF